jgi:ribosomal protein S18 acetylase RimI-like enzyme
MSMRRPATAVEIASLEHRLADLWPALADEPLGEWRMRAAGEFTGRANSTLAVGEPGMPVAEALRRTEVFARRHGISPRAHVVLGASAEQAIRDAGWVVDTEHPAGSETAVLTGPLPTAMDLAPDGTGLTCKIHVAPTASWWRLTAGTSTPTPAQRHVLATGDQVGFGTAELGGRAVGAVRGAVLGGMLHVARLAVAPERRRRGVATALLGALYAWARSQGAGHQALQVATHNAAALRLYRGLGCVPHHRYRYWVPAITRARRR